MIQRRLNVLPFSDIAHELHLQHKKNKTTEPLKSIHRQNGQLPGCWAIGRAYSPWYWCATRKSDSFCINRRPNWWNLLNPFSALDCRWPPNSHRMHSHGRAHHFDASQHCYLALYNESKCYSRIVSGAVHGGSHSSIHRFLLTFFPVEFLQSKYVRPHAHQGECTGGQC